MEKNLLKANASSITKSTILTVISHLLLPLTLFPFAFFMVPPFAAKSSEMGIEISKLTSLVFNLSSYICRYWYLCILILAFAVTIDAVIYFSLYRFKKKNDFSPMVRIGNSHRNCFCRFVRHSTTFIPASYVTCPRLMSCLN